MAAANLDVFRNGTFVFEVDGAKFTVHRNLVARNSKTLKAEMENGMAESQAGSSALQDTEELTFGRFVEFIYTGDYNPADPVEATQEAVEQESVSDIPAAKSRESSTEAPSIPDHGIDPTVEGEVDGWGLFASNPPKKSSSKKRRDYEETSQETQTLAKKPTLPRLEFKIDFEHPLPTNSAFSAKDDWTLDFLPVFLSHAQLYAFADTYGIPKLQTLAAARLHESLQRFQYLPNSATNVAELVQYVYEHTPDRIEGTDKARAIVTHFCTENVRALQSSEAFMRLVASGGPFARALVGRMCDLLSSVEM